jgi:hypothetical protein
VTRIAERLGRSGWRLFPLLAVPLYLATFAAVPRLATADDVIGDADSAAYTLLLTEWSLARRFGDARRPLPHGTGDRAQEHKIKHVLTPLLYAPVVTLGRRAFSLLGFPAQEAAVLGVKFPGALVGAASIGVAGLILLQLAVQPLRVLWACALLTFAPGFWIYASIPESWPLSGLLTLLALYAFVRWPSRDWPVAIITGVAMVNCAVLGIVSLLPMLAVLVGYHPRPRRLAEALRLCRAPLIAVVVWATVLGVLSLADSDLRPDRVVQYLRFFPSLLAPDELPRWSFRMVKLSLQQWWFTPLASLQGDITLVGHGLGTTMRSSGRGMLSVVMVLLLWAIVATGWLRPHRSSSPRRRLAALLAVLTTTLWLVLHQGSAVSMLLYAPVLLPLTLVGLALLSEALTPVATTALAVPSLWLMISGVLQVRLIAALAV